MRAWRAAFVSVAAVTLLSCSTSVEQQFLSQFFNASRLRDLTALQSILAMCQHQLEHKLGLADYLLKPVRSPFFFPCV